MMNGLRSLAEELWAFFLHVSREVNEEAAELGKSGTAKEEGSMGLMKSLEKFKPQVGCRFSTYAYWWIRQSIRKAVVLKYRTIRLPENVHALTQIKNARKSYIQEGHHPTNEELAKRVGITVEKMEMLLASARNALSIQQTAWQDEGATFQEITADPGVEIPEISATKQLMGRHHMHNLLSILSPREREADNPTLLWNS